MKHYACRAAIGIRALPDGERKNSLALTLNGLVGLFEGRILPFDVDAARQYADLAVAVKVAGRGLPAPHGYIAAIAVSRKFIVASRDTDPFRAAGITAIDPWAP